MHALMWWVFLLLLMSLTVITWPWFFSFFFFFQERSVSLRSENRKQKPCHLAIIALTTRPVPTGLTSSWWVFSLLKGCDSGQCLISEFCISSRWLATLCPNTTKCTKLFFPVIVQMHIWLWCNCSEWTERTVTSDLPVFILCYHR